VDLTRVLDASQFVGRAPEQVDAFVANIIDPIRRQHADTHRQEAEQVQGELLKKVRLETSRKVEEVRGVLEKQVRDASLQLRQYTQGVGQEIVAKILNSE
jgi:hypothetical protein